MRRLRAWLIRFGGMFNAVRRERELSEELESHVQFHIEDNLRAGLPPEEARRQALMRLGGMEQTKELYRERRSLPGLETLLQDLRYGLRTLRKAPGFTAVAVATLALGIGATTAIFSVVYGVVLRPLPYRHPEQIVQLTETYRGSWDEKDVTYNQLQFLQEHNRGLQHVGAFTVTGLNLALGRQSERLNALNVSAQYFDVLGVKPILGRSFLPEEDRGNGVRVAILSYSLWQRRLGRGEILGRTISLDGEPYTVVGVMPPNIERLAPNPLIRGNTDIWTPLALVGRTAGSGENLAVIGRLKPEVSLAQARAQIAVVGELFRKTFPEELSPEVQLSWEPYRAMLSADVKTILFILLGAVGLVLLIACANVANLLLGRAAGRSREIALRMALGASRGRLFRQLLTESLLVGVLGGAAGLGTAVIALPLLLRLSPRELPRISDIRVDGWVLAFTAGLGILTGIGFGLAPGLQSWNWHEEGLKQGVGRMTAGRGRTRVRRALAVAEIGLSLILLSGAALLAETFLTLLRSDPGFQPSHVLTMQVWVAGSSYESTPAINGFYERVLARVRELPGVERAAVVAAGLPLERGGNIGISIGGKPTVGTTNGIRMVSPAYFATMGIPLQAGRVFESGDDQNGTPVAVVSQSFARQQFPGQTPLGAYLRLADMNWRIVGVVGDVKSYLDQPAQPTVFVPLAQAPYEFMKLFEAWIPTEIVVRTAGEPLARGRALQQTVQSVDPSVASGHIRSMDQIRSSAVAMREFNMTLLSMFAGAALLLAAIGIYGVIAFVVTQRTQELGVRMALGAQRGDVLRLVLGEGLRLAATGIAAGLAGTLALTRILQTFLYGVSPSDPIALVCTTLLLGGIALFACYIPARRAMKVDPMVALRYQ